MLVLASSSHSLATQVATALLVIAVAALAVPVTSAFRRKLRIAKGLAPVPGPKGWPLLGMLPEVIRHSPRVHEYFEALQVEYNGRMKMSWSIFMDGTIWVGTPEDIQWVLATNHDNYIRSPRFIAAVGRVFDKSFLGLNHAHTPDNGAMIRLQRKLGIRVFTTNNFKIFTEQVFRKYADETVAVIKAQGGKCDMHEVSSQYTLQSIFDIACDIPLKELDPSRGLAFIGAMDYVFSNLTDRLVKKPYYKYLWWCMPSEYTMKRNEQVMLDLAEDILTRRLRETDDEIAARSDIMSLFIQKARELQADEGEGAAILDVATLRSILLSFLFAGKDTSASVITYVFYVLAQYPDVQQKLYDEVSKVEKLSYDDVKSLPYLDAVVNETMRLYPTLPSTFRVAVEDDHLPDGTFIPAGTQVGYASWYMGRHNPVFGEHRELFRPERWLVMKTRPSAYDLPSFSAGPRICIGMNMAAIEVRMFVAVMLREFHVKIQDGEQVKDRPYVLGPTLSMAGGLPLQMTPRVQVA